MRNVPLSGSAKHIIRLFEKPSRLRRSSRRASSGLYSSRTGALFALNPPNPDAARHFCTSAREVLTSILDIAAPDSMVIRAHAECDVTDKGNPSRRAKIRYLLSRKGITDVSADQFVEADIDNAVSLFRMFNKGMHGVAGRFSIPQLSALRTRVEASIGFLNSIIWLVAPISTELLSLSGGFVPFLDYPVELTASGSSAPACAQHLPIFTPRSIGRQSTPIQSPPTRPTTAPTTASFSASPHRPANSL
jgi:Predicted pPIWI-associating nuclease